MQQLDSQLSLQLQSLQQRCDLTVEIASETTAAVEYSGLVDTPSKLKPALSSAVARLQPRITTTVAVMGTSLVCMVYLIILVFNA